MIWASSVIFVTRTGLEPVRLSTFVLCTHETSSIALVPNVATYFTTWLVWPPFAGKSIVGAIN